MKQYGENGEKCLRAEIQILKELKHPNIYRIIDVKENSKDCMILAECVGFISFNVGENLEFIKN